MIVVLMGRPGCGKGEVSQVLATKGFKHLSTGNILRAEHEPGTKLHQLVQPCLPYLRASKMVPDELFLPVWAEFAPTLAQSGRVVVDGFPRNPDQAKRFVSSLNHIPSNKLVYLLELLVPDDECLRRMVVRARPDDVDPELRLKIATELTLPAIAIVRQCRRVISPKAINTHHPKLSTQESIQKVAGRACRLIGLPSAELQLAS